MSSVVLLVDDDFAVLDALRRNLRNEPYEILIATSAADALGILNTMKIDVVVTDEDMPGVNGSELLDAMEHLHIDTVKIMLTGKPSLELAMRAINASRVFRFFTKPSSYVELGAAIRDGIRQRQGKAQTLRIKNLSKKTDEFADSLEAQHPGITSVRRTSSGTIILDDSEGVESE